MIRHTWVLLGLIAAGTLCQADAAKTEIQYLSGRGPDTAVAWDFYCTGGRQSGQWATIHVPSNWELEGFGTYNYGGDKVKSDEQGKYRKTFQIPADWKEKKIILVFEAVMTDTEVFVNGISAGPIHQGGFYEFEYDITQLIKQDAENLLEVTVSKVSANASVEAAERQADYWVFGGIYRPVYLKAVPAESIDWTAIDARDSGLFRINVYTSGIESCNRLTAQIFDKNGAPVAGPLTAEIRKGQQCCTLTTTIVDPANWTAETPHLYTVELQLKQQDQIVHTATERFGFRTIEVRPDGLFLNGRRIVLKGVNRHSFRAETGRCLSPQDDIDDVRLIKSMNMNAVRMSHYPQNKSFYEACDELGLYVLDELAGWQKPPYDTEVGKKLIKEMLRRDINYPCILLWDNGNEGGFNTELDAEFGRYDPQNRLVLHPWLTFSGVDTDHYESYKSTQNKLKGPVPYLPTEFLHGLYDGGHGAGLEDYWDIMKHPPYGAGGFLWVLADEGAVRTDKDGQIDTDGNHAPDGIVGPCHEKEGSYYTIRQIWSPVQIDMQTISESFDGTVPVENCYDFSDLNTVTFTWQLVDFPPADSAKDGHTVRQEAKTAGPDIAAGKSGTLRLDLPADWKSYDGLFLTATDQYGQDLWTWSWALTSRAQMTAVNKRTDADRKIKAVTNDGSIIVTADTMQFTFDSAAGLLKHVACDGQDFALANGPRRVPAGDPNAVVKVTSSETDGTYIIRADCSGGLDYFQWTVYPNGHLGLEYTYSLQGAFDYFGITFDLPEEAIRGMRWLGQGPSRVWKNRLKGTRLDVWQRDYNRGIPGYVWEYPVFAGCYADLYWLDLKTDAGAIIVSSPAASLYFRVGQLRNGPDPIKAIIPTLDGDVSFLQAISPIGTKFLKPVQMGPAGAPNQADGTYRGQLLFQFQAEN